jgi:acyl dehydratase
MITTAKARTPWRPGDQLGASDWLLIDQTRNDVFGAVTDDLEPLHNDPNWCARNSPFGATIAYGFLTLSLLTRFLHEVTDNRLAGAADKIGFPLNYGFDRVRFISPVRVGSRIRCRLTVEDVRPHAEGEMLRFAAVIEAEGEDKPALTADWLTLWVEDGAAGGRD